MPGTTTTQEIELVIEKKGGGGGGDLPPADRNGGGGDDGKKKPNRSVSPRRYYTGMAIGIVAILMFFMALASAFLVRRGGPDWVPVHIPALLWVNTAVLLASSGTLEMARKRLANADVAGFQTILAGNHHSRRDFPARAGGGVANFGGTGNLPGQQSCQQLLLYFHGRARVALAWAESAL